MGWVVTGSPFNDKKKHPVSSKFAPKKRKDVFQNQYWPIGGTGSI